MLENWVPYKLTSGEDRPYCEWLMEKIKTRARYHAKYPEQVFAEEALREPVPVYCRAAYDKYEALEKMRNS